MQFLRNWIYQIELGNNDPVPNASAVIVYTMLYIVRCTVDSLLTLIYKLHFNVSFQF